VKKLAGRVITIVSNEEKSGCVKKKGSYVYMLKVLSTSSLKARVVVKKRVRVLW
jgi:hypothetical protein